MTETEEVAAIPLVEERLQVGNETAVQKIPVTLRSERAEIESEEAVESEGAREAPDRRA